ncbi:MAG: SdpI family protein [Gemmatimonadaceae bacterium]
MRKWIPLLVIVLAFGASAAVYSDLPERVPTHWNLSGEVDGWMSREWGAFLMPLILVAQLGLFYVLPRIDPRGANYTKFKSTYDILIITLMIFMLGVHLLILAAAVGVGIPITRIVPAGVGILFIVLGNLMPRMRPNWFVGIKTPWTLSSDRVWDRTHRFSGRLFVVVGALIVLSALLAPALAKPVLGFAPWVLVIAVLAYSYIIWRNDPEARKNTASRA